MKNDTILSTSIPSLVATTGSCETVNEVTHFYYTDAGLNKRRASELAPKRLFVAENCLDVAVRHYRIAPRMKWCDESGKELFTSSQKRIWTRGFSLTSRLKDAGSETKFWFTRPATPLPATKPGVPGGLEEDSTTDRVPATETELQQLLPKLQHKQLSLICAYLPDSAEYAPDYQFAVNGVQCPKISVSKSLGDDENQQYENHFITIGNFAWMQCVQELMVFLSGTDIVGQPQFSAPDLEYLQRLFATFSTRRAGGSLHLPGHMFTHRVVLDYEIPQPALWAWEWEDHRDENQNTTEMLKAAKPPSAGGKVADIIDMAILKATSEDTRSQELGRAEERHLKSRASELEVVEVARTDDHSSENAAPTNLNLEPLTVVASQQNGQRHHIGSTSKIRPFLPVTDKNLFALTTQDFHNNALLLAAQRKQLDQFHPFVHRESALAFVGAGVPVGKDNADRVVVLKTAGSRTTDSPAQHIARGRLELFDYYDGTSSTLSSAVDKGQPRKSIDQKANIVAQNPDRVRLNPWLAYLNTIQGTLRRNFLKLMQKPFQTLLHEINFYPTAVVTVCPYFHRFLTAGENQEGHVAATDRTTELRSSTTSLANKPRFFQMPLMTKNVFQQQGKESHSHEVEDRKKMVSFLREDRPIDLLYVGNSMGEMQSELFVPMPPVTTSRKGGEPIKVVSTKSDRQRPQPISFLLFGHNQELLAEKYMRMPGVVGPATAPGFGSRPETDQNEDNRDMNDNTESEEATGVDALKRNFRERLNIDLHFHPKALLDEHQSGSEEGRVSKQQSRSSAVAVDDHTTTIAVDGDHDQADSSDRRGLLLHQEQPDVDRAEVEAKNAEHSYESKLRLYGKAKTCFTHNLIAVEPRETQFLTKWVGSLLRRARPPPAASGGRDGASAKQRQEENDRATATPGTSAGRVLSNPLLADFVRLSGTSEKSQPEEGGVAVVDDDASVSSTQESQQLPSLEDHDTLRHHDFTFAKLIERTILLSKRSRRSANTGPKKASFKEENYGGTHSSSTFAVREAPNDEEQIRTTFQLPLLGYPSGLPVARLPQLKARGFEAAMGRCLNLVLFDHWNVFEQFFTPGEDFLYVLNINEAVAIARWVSESIFGSSSGERIELQAGGGGDDYPDRQNEDMLVHQKNLLSDRQTMEAMLESAYARASTNYTFDWFGRELPGLLSNTEASV
ncbi:unnamed protein product [Amoebophrya sp. A120]|nr:unnamed protein product [Amoebophrya sp. A120]|eukprot:GSA120T00007550001.1